MDRNPRPVDSQCQSPLFALLPLEIRHQIQLYYIAGYLRDCCHATSYQFQYPYLAYITPGDLSSISAAKRFSCPLSPLTLSCKLMFAEMRHSPYLLPPSAKKTSKNKHLSKIAAEAVSGTAATFALFYHRRNDQSIHIARGSALNVVAEGAFYFPQIRILRFVNEDESPLEEAWIAVLTHLISHATNLLVLEVEFSRKMSILPLGPHNTRAKVVSMLDSLAAHKTLKRVILRGNTPELWANHLRDAPGVKVSREPLVWFKDDNTFLELERDKILKKKKADIQAYHDRRLWINTPPDTLHPVTPIVPMPPRMRRRGKGRSDCVVS